MNKPRILWLGFWLLSGVLLRAAVVVPGEAEGIPPWLVPGRSSEDIPDDILAPRTLLEHQELAPQAAWERLARIATIKDTVRQAMVMHAGRRYQDALALLEGLDQDLPGQPDIYLAQSDALYRLGRYEDALARSDQAIEALNGLQEDDRRPRTVRLLCLERLRRHGEALLEVELLLKKEPAHTGLLERRAWNLLQNGQPAEAEAQYFALTQTLPDHPLTHLWAAHAMRANRRTARAQLAYSFTLELAVEPEVRAEALNGLGMIAFDRNHQEEALDFFEQALSLSPTNPRILRNKARVLRQGDDLMPAIDTLLLALSSDLLSPLSWRMYIDALQQHLDLPRPQSLPETLRGADADTILLWRLSRIQGALSGDDAAQALADCLAAIEITMRDAQLLNNTGVLVRQSIGPKGGTPFFQLALLADPSFAAARHNLEHTHATEKRPQQAHQTIAQIKEHLATHPGDVSARYQLAEAYLRDGLPEPALETLELLLARAPRHPAAQVLRARIRCETPALRGPAILDLAIALQAENETGWSDLIELLEHLFTPPEDWRPVHPAQGMSRRDRAAWYARQAGLQRRRERPQEARYYTLMAARTEPRSPPRLQDLAQATLELPSLVPLTNALALRAWAIDPSEETREKSLAIAASALEQKGLEIKQGDTYRLGPVPTAVHAYNLAQAGDYPAALALYERILSESPGHIGARTGRIRVLAYQQQFAQSIQEAKRLVDEYPEQVEAHALYGWALLKFSETPAPSLRAFLETFRPLAHLPEHFLLVLETQKRLPGSLDGELLKKTREAIERLPHSLRRARLEERLAQLT